MDLVGIVSLLLFCNLGEFNVYGICDVEDVGGPIQDYETSSEGGNAKRPQEQPVKHHCHYAPILVLLNMEIIAVTHIVSQHSETKYLIV